MQGYVVDREGKPIQFRVFDPNSETTRTGVMLVRGMGITIVDATPGQLQPSTEQLQPTPATAPAALNAAQAAALGVPHVPAPAPAMPADERGVVVQDQAQPQPVPAAAPAVPPAQPAAAAADTTGDPLQQGAAAEL